QYLRKLALYDGINELAELDVAANVMPGGDLQFSGFEFVVPDDGEKALSVKASFNSADIDDNEVITFRVVAVGARLTASSQFANTMPSGVESAVNGNENRLEVIATHLDIFVPNATASLF